MNKEWKEEQIRDYLLGRLGEKETEEIDELSVSDDEFALRLASCRKRIVRLLS